MGGGRVEGRSKRAWVEVGGTTNYLVKSDPGAVIGLNGGRTL